MNGIDPSGEYFHIIAGAIIGAICGYWMDGWRGLAVGAVSGAIGAFSWPMTAAAVTGARIAGVLASFGAGLFIPLYNGLSDNWGIKKTNNKKKVAVVYGDVGYMMGISLFFNNISIAGFVQNARDAGHNINLHIKPTEKQFFEICQNNELVLVVAHGYGLFLSAQPLMYDSNQKVFSGFRLGGIDTNSVEEHLTMGDPEHGAPYPISPSPHWITAHEIDGKINNPNLVIAAAACRVGNGKSNWRCAFCGTK
jgi:hypothetical protein